MSYNQYAFHRLLPAALLAFAAMYSRAAPVPVIQIFQARSSPLGATVTVQGLVTTPSGVFNSSLSDKGFGLQDKTSGIYVSLETDLDAKIGQKARVTGTLQERSGLLILVPASSAQVQLCDKGNQVQPKLLATRDIGEATEGRIVRIEGTITQAPKSDLPYGYKLFVHDGSGELLIFINVQTGIDLNSFADDTDSFRTWSYPFRRAFRNSPASLDGRPAPILVGRREGNACCVRRRELRRE